MKKLKKINKKKFGGIQMKFKKNDLNLEQGLQKE